MIKSKSSLNVRTAMAKPVCRLVEVKATLASFICDTSLGRSVRAVVIRPSGSAWAKNVIQDDLVL